MGMTIPVKPAYTIMKKLALAWLCLALTTAFTLAADYHLYEAQIADGEFTERSGLAGKFPPTVWVLSQDGQQPLVFQKFDSPMMEAHLRLLPHDSVIHLHASPMIADPDSSAHWESFKAFCQKNGIKFVDDSLPD
jgi:hypothetical protein